MFDPADLIHTYTRAQAVDDGVLIPVPSELAQQAGFKCPMALTAAAWGGCVEWSPEDESRQDAGQDERGRLWDVLWMAGCAARRSLDGSQTAFTVLRVPRRGPVVALPVRLVLTIGPGDVGEAVATILMEGED
jgi:hypothetical protein